MLYRACDGKITLENRSSLCFSSKDRYVQATPNHYKINSALQSRIPSPCAVCTTRPPNLIQSRKTLQNSMVVSVSLSFYGSSLLLVTCRFLVVFTFV